MMRLIGTLCCFAGGFLLPLDLLKDPKALAAIFLMMVGVGIGMFVVGKNS